MSEADNFVIYMTYSLPLFNSDSSA